MNHARSRMKKEGDAESKLSLPVGNAPKIESMTNATSTPQTVKSPPRSSNMSPGIKDENGGDGSLHDVESTTKIVEKPKSTKRSVQLFNDLPSATEESLQAFQVIHDCMYGSKSMGASHNDILDCDCAEDWHDGENHACGDDSDCINRATKMECVHGDCNCGPTCQNQRFQRKQYADVSVIKTEKKGYGLRADKNLQANDFIFEYIGEVINEPTFRRRMMQYDREGIKHFYFMSLTRTEFVDATKKGNLGRFCNHSCAPNSYVDKWVVGDKLRMGIFASRKIEAGEEVVFNYNVDRYGADPQPCYCGEPNCTGFIGGKTQTERATKLSAATVEALGIDEDDAWDTAVAKKPRKKKASEDDEDYVNSLQVRELEEKGVTKVMAALMQCKEKWIAVKLLQRIQESNDDRVRARVLQMHGYQILKTVLVTFKEDDNVVLQILEVLHRFPRVTKNKIVDAKIEAVVETLAPSENEKVAESAARLLEEWSKLETGYRIPRRKFDASIQAVNSYDERRNQDREADAKNLASPLPASNVPKGPRNLASQRSGPFPPFRPRRPIEPPPLPQGWFMAKGPAGDSYYYTKSGTTTWQRPTAPAVEGPTRKEQHEKAVQDIIDSLSKEAAVRPTATSTPQSEETPVKESKKEKWRSLPIEKQQKIYENTLFPHVKYVMDKFRHKLPKDELKRFAKEVNKKLVASDYKSNRVDDPTSITPKQEKKVKGYVKDYLDRAVHKYQAHEKAKKLKADLNGKKHTDSASKTAFEAATTIEAASGLDAAFDDSIVLSDVEDSLQVSSPKKRKRDLEDETMGTRSPTPEEPPSIKRLKEDEDAASSPAAPSPPPPPPPPPEAPVDVIMSDVNDQVLDDTALCEAADTQLDPEAQRIADQEEQDRIQQEEALQRENEEAMREFEMAQSHNDKGLEVTASDSDGGGAVDLGSTDHAFGNGNGMGANGTHPHEVLGH